MQDEELAQHQVSMLLFVALACGIGMFLFTKLFGTQVLTGKSLSKHFKEKKFRGLKLSSCLSHFFEALIIVIFLMKSCSFF